MDVLHAMRAFVRVVDAGSFTAAANALGLSTAQVSRVVSDLESQLEARLLHRTTRRLALTETGERYLQRCREILADVDEAQAEASGAHLNPRGRLRVHSLTGLGQQHLIPLISRYCESFPEVYIELTLAQRQPDILEEGQDVVITRDRELPDSEFVAQTLGTIYSVLCASPEYLKRRGTPTSVADLHQHQCLRLQDPTFPEGWAFEEGNEESVIRPRDTFMVNVAEALTGAAAAGMGICLLPSYVAAPALRRRSLVRVLPRHSLHVRQIYALYPSRRFLDAKIRTWVEFLKAELPRVFEEDEAALNDPVNWA
ncbi:LysR family transcriptional regulator [Pseudomonas sp. Pseusp97]|uniref:LysR family transcriptional regulator n=1 Tax=Pseudomonas sp. Pseusp97 TaxID=3243065 RepID=UPI0039A5B176